MIERNKIGKSVSFTNDLVMKNQLSLPNFGDGLMPNNIHKSNIKNKNNKHNQDLIHSGLFI